MKSPLRADGPRLLADIGGTNARFGWQAGPDAPITHVHTYACAQSPSPLAAMRRYLADMAHTAPRLAAVGIANPVTGDAVNMTNHHWSFSVKALEAALGVERLVVINDFEALALALPALDAHETVQIGGGEAVPGAPIALIGPGTGLGMAGLVAVDERWVAIAGEGGHATLSPETPREMAVAQWLRQRFGHASVERAVSGPGLVWLYEALAELDGESPESTLAAADVAERAHAGTDPRASEALMMFLAFLGCAAGNLALTLGARGGVYIGGGIVPRLVGMVQASPLLERFCSKGRMKPLLQPIPLRVITALDSPALRGVARAL